MLNFGNIGSMISMGFRLINHRGEIEQMVPRVLNKAQDVGKAIPQIQSMITEATSLLGDIRSLAEKIAPELVPAATGRAAQLQPEQKFDVRWLQQSLNELMSSRLHVDGIYGERTQTVIRAFQERHGLVPDGWAGVQTEAKIFELLQQRRER